jgi:WD40 repeat protein
LYLCISANSKLLAWVDRDCSVCLWDLANEREIPFVGPPLLEGWHNLAFWPDSDHLTFGTVKRTFETWDAHTARKASSLGQVKEGTGVAASADGRWLANADPTLWSSNARSRGLALLPESALIWSLAWSPDGERLAVGLADGGLVIWNVPRVQAELTRIGLAWRAEARPPQE